MEVCSQNLFDPKTVLLKVNGNKCNMNCEYCSEIPKNFTEEQCTFNLEKIVALLSKLPKNVDIILHGGEPSLIGIENVKILADLINEMGFKIKPSIQTNGFLSYEWIEFFDANKEIIRLSVSIDGDEYCNSYRRTKNEESNIAFKTVDKFLHEIDKKDIEFRCIATINSLSWDKGDKVVDYFNQYKNLKFVRLNPCFDVDEYGIKRWAITPLQYLECLKSAFNYMLKTESYKKYKLDPLMDITENLKRNTVEYEFKCNKFSSIFPNGIVTSCDAMREVTQQVEIGEDMFDNFIQPDYVSWCKDKCNKCSNLSLCKGGCPPLMYRYKKCAPDLLEEYCQYRVDIRQYVLETLKE